MDSALLTTAPRDQGLEIKMTVRTEILAHDTVGCTDDEIRKAERAFEERILAMCPSIDLLYRIHKDDAEGSELEHFENCKSAWWFLCAEGQRAAWDAIGRRPGNGATIEMFFHGKPENA